jgi:hypothetical protein
MKPGAEVSILCLRDHWQKPPAEKPEAQAEGNHALDPQHAFPRLAPRASKAVGPPRPPTNLPPANLPPANLPPAAKPEAQAEGNHALDPQHAFPRLAPRASKAMVPHGQPANLPPANLPPAAKPEAQAEGNHALDQQHTFPRLAARVSRRSVPLSRILKKTDNRTGRTVPTLNVAASDDRQPPHPDAQRRRSPKNMA